MTERFREPDRAISYLSTGLRHDFPGATAEIILVSKARSRRMLCCVDEARPVLESFCKNFRNVSLDYFPGNVYGVVAEIRSHGDGSDSDGDRHRHKRHEHKERPFIIVVLQDLPAKAEVAVRHAETTSSKA